MKENKMENKFTAGTRVIASINDADYSDGEIISYVHCDYDDYTLHGVVIDKLPHPGNVWVLWDENDHDIEEEEVDVSLLTLESDRSKIEEQFKVVQVQIKEKMAAAAGLVLEANALAESGHAVLAQMYDSVRPLVSAMDSSGWRSSSWGC